MSQVDEPPDNVHTMRTIGIVWAGAGVVALIVAAVFTVWTVAIFGVLALLIGGGLYALQQVRERSVHRTARTLNNAPPPPSSAPNARPPRTSGHPPSGAPGALDEPAPDPGADADVVVEPDIEAPGSPSERPRRTGAVSTDDPVPDGRVREDGVRNNGVPDDDSDVAEVVEEPPDATRRNVRLVDLSPTERASDHGAASEVDDGPEGTPDTRGPS